MKLFAKCEPEPQVPRLTIRDLCDLCGLQAAIRVRLQSGRLLDFCGHDYRKHEPALSVRGAVVIHVVPLGEGA